MISEADQLIRKLVLHRDGYKCLRCGKTEDLQIAHILPKGHYPRLRFELHNVLLLDIHCHLFWAHKDPLEFTAWLENKFPGRSTQLRAMARLAGRVDLKELLIGLRLEASKL
jgi:5-methylcytosine-specific restriction endonuclease McrA